jgi:hypothetical protein
MGGGNGVERVRRAAAGRQRRWVVREEGKVVHGVGRSLVDVDVA